MKKLGRIVAASLARPGPWLPIGAATALLAWTTTRAILTATGGAVAVPLDDTFIHFQFARAFAELRPFEYSLGSPRVPGATSLLWPLALAPFHALGFRGPALIWIAWAGGWTALGLLAHETWRMCQGLLSPAAATATAVMVLTFGGHVWCAASGMEVIPFAWLLMRTARRGAEFAEAPPSAAYPAKTELLALAWLTPLMRPEGALASLFVAATLFAFCRGTGRALGLLALAGPAGPGLVNWLATGEATSTTVAAKWLFATPYPTRIPATLRYHVDLFFNTLLDGQVWSAIFIPRGGKWIAWLSLPAVVWAASRQGHLWRGAAVVLLGAGVLATTTFDTFLVNRLRYLWPFAAAWFVGLGALADAAGAVASRWRVSGRTVRALVAGGMAGLFLGRLSFTLDDVATSARAINDQQVALAGWAARELPADAVIGVNDAGALTYLSGRRTFDLMGLTTRGEARHWVAGPGSRFEHYERLDRGRLPTHLVVYDRWLQVPPILGEYLTHRYVGDSTILGDATMTAYVARWDALGTGTHPAGIAPAAIHDEVDVADLVSESEHDYALLSATQQENVVVEGEDGRVDGGRAGRFAERFQVELRPGGHFIARLHASEPTTLEVRFAGQTARVELLGNGSWEELSLAVPAATPSGRHPVAIDAVPARPFTSLHYWATD